MPQPRLSLFNLRGLVSTRLSVTLRLGLDIPEVNVNEIQRAASEKAKTIKSGGCAGDGAGNDPVGRHRCRPFEVPLITATTRYDLDSGPASQCTRHFAQVGRIVGVEASPACRRLDGAIGRDEHQDWIANRVTIADPG